MSEPQAVPLIKMGTYRHYKGNVYTVVGVALHTETNEPLVLYTPLSEKKLEYWVRPYAMFFEDVVIDGTPVPRFRFISE